MNIRNYNQAGYYHAGRLKVDKPIEIIFDVNEFDNNIIEEDDVHSEVDSIEQEFDTYTNILLKNPNLNTNFLIGSHVIISNEQNGIHIESKPIYKDSTIMTHDLILYLEFLKCSMKLGDKNIAIILGMLASTLPQPNAISEALKSSSRTIYHYLNFMQRNVVNSARASIHECPVCSKGCIAFVGLYSGCIECPICHTSRDVSSEVCSLIFLSYLIVIIFYHLFTIFY